MVFDVEKNEICRVENTFGFQTQTWVKTPSSNPDLLDLCGVVYTKYGKIKLLISLKTRYLNMNTIH